MAEVDFLLGAAFEAQSTAGTAQTMPAIGGGSGTAGAINNVTDGAVMGDPDSGTGETGIEYQWGRKSTEKAVITGSFSKGFSNFIGRTLEGLSVTIPMKGNGGTTSTPAVSADFTPDIGLAALWASAGLPGAGSGSLWGLTPGPTQIATAALYLGNASGNGARAIMRDLISDTVTLEFTPGEIGRATFSLSGEFATFDEGGTWPASPFEYGNQGTLSAPPVQNVSFQWGPNTPAVRSIGFESLSIEINNEATVSPGSNFALGERSRQEGRTITASGVIDADSAEILFEMNQLGEASISNAESLTFTVGTIAGSAATANAYTISMLTPELTSLEPAKIAGSQGWSIELVGRATVSGSELDLQFK
tara:strand:+ start:1531 stop:2619 length:1089 start_codon:yes stop_codon:yes gene_type:complete